MFAMIILFDTAYINQTELAESICSSKGFFNDFLYDSISFAIGIGAGTAFHNR